MADEHPAVTRFREYLRQKSVHPDPDYEGCIDWLKRQAEEIGLEYNIKEFDGHKSFVIWLTWKGKESKLQSVLLNSHIDVVPVDPSKWTYDPFEAHKDEKGNIYARGSQDMKCVGAQYLEAIRNLKATGYSPLRNVHVCFVPDEEVGGVLGMKKFVDTKEFQDLNIGFGLDEGVADPGDAFPLFFGERVIWQTTFTAKGQTGHGSLLHENTAAEKMHYVINRMLDWRTKEKQRMIEHNLTLGDITTINLTMWEGGLQANVVPPVLSVTFDIRITPRWELHYVESVLDEICKQAGTDVSYEFIQKCEAVEVTKLDDDNPWWLAFKRSADELGIRLTQLIFPAGTDSRFLRGKNIPALGFSPMNNTPVLLHDHDEYLNEKIYLRGIEIYQHILPNIFDVPKNDSL